MSSEKLRNFLSKVSCFISEKLSSRRINASLPIKITICPEIPTGSLKNPKRLELSILGETLNLSLNGVAFIVPSIRLREYYLVGEDRKLYAEIDLPSSKVTMELLGVRYEQINIHDSASKYLIGAKILSIAPEHKEVYEEFCRLGGKLDPSKKKITAEAKS
ncbi:MAG: PilZ domain-containing protein [Pyrinomonadaceae bacterium]|nr:PilZ domain-containing protein [Pyrinomonadaceae bacterium]MCX7640706.1 PilZ domain-containing protein [Pyrinomonadaceae bacterium]